MCANQIKPSRPATKTDLSACHAHAKKQQKAQHKLGVPREERHKWHSFFVVGSDGSLQITPY